MTFETILVKNEGAVARITLNRPSRLNAISRKLILEVNSALDTIETDENISAIVIDGKGRAFSAGMDLKDDAVSGFSSTDEWHQVLSEDLNFIMRFWDCPKPTIAVTHGYCLAAACELSMACDITIAEENTFFGEPELKFASVITAMLMPYLTGPKIAKELLLTAEDHITAERAYEIGLINHVTPPGQGLKKAMLIAERLAKMDKEAIRLTKYAINGAFDSMGLRETLKKNLELAVKIETLETPTRKKFKEIAASKGLKAALDWRDNRINGKEEDR